MYEYLDPVKGLLPLQPCVLVEMVGKGIMMIKDYELDIIAHQEKRL
jgi:hypothetical protein